VVVVVAAAVMVVAVTEGSFWAVEGADRRPQSRAFTPCRDDNRASFVLERALESAGGFAVELSETDRSDRSNRCCPARCARFDPVVVRRTRGIPTN